MELSVEDIEKEITRATLCHEATYTGEMMREILRLALIGAKLETFLATNELN